MTGQSLISASEAAALLGVRPATLYAYVSRGLLRSEPGPGRESLYRRADLLALKERRRRGRSPGLAARASLDFGLPVLESAITLIEGGALHYRGQPVATLAAHASLEDVAGLIWQVAGEGPFEAANLPPAKPVAPRDRTLASLPFLARAQVELTLDLAFDRGAFARTRGGVARLGARALRRLSASAVGGAPDARPIHRRLGEGWGLDAADVDLLRAALVLAADHELNPSTFTVRAVASTLATVYEALLAGLAALSGPRHGGMTARVAALLTEIGAGAPDSALARILDRDEALPGFGHRLYPDGDPRAAILLRLLGARHPQSEERQRIAAVADAAWRDAGLRPNIDFALVALARTLSLPGDAPFVLFTIGRTVGWVGHVIEQYESGEMIRPRARYVGLRPQPDGATA